MKKRYITLTLVSSELKQEVLDKLDSNEELQDEYGRTEKDYLELNIKVPEFFKTKRINPDKEFENIENFNFYNLELKLQPDKIDFIIEGEDFGSKIHYNQNYTLDVKETPEEVEEIINQFDIYNKK